MMQIFGLLPAESEIDVYVAMKNQVRALIGAVCQRKKINKLSTGCKHSLNSMVIIRIYYFMKEH